MCVRIAGALWPVAWCCATRRGRARVGLPRCPCPRAHHGRLGRPPNLSSGGAEERGSNWRLGGFGDGCCFSILVFYPIVLCVYFFCLLFRCFEYSFLLILYFIVLCIFCILFHCFFSQYFVYFFAHLCICCCSWCWLYDDDEVGVCKFFLIVFVVLPLPIPPLLPALVPPPHHHHYYPPPLLSFIYPCAFLEAIIWLSSVIFPSI